MKQFRKQLCTLFLALIVNFPVQALTSQELASLREAVHEMCLLPDRSGDILKAEGVAVAGMAVPIKILRGNISGKISYDTWKGIPITLDKYKTDPRQCAMEMMKLLIPTFSPSSSSTTSPKKTEGYLDLKDLKLGMSRDEFGELMLGRAISWQSTDKGLRATYNSNYLGVPTAVNHYFQSDRLTRSEYSGYAEFLTGERRSGHYGPMSPSAINNTLSKDEFHEVCRKYDELPSRMLAKFGEALEPEKEKLIEYRDDILNSPQCRAPAVCTFEDNYQIGVLRTLKFLFKDRALAKLDVKSFTKSFLITYPSSERSTFTSACTFSLLVEYANS